MRDFQQYIRVSSYLTIATVYNAAILSLVLGWSLTTFSKLALIMGLNILSLPLLLTGVFTFPLWVWYVVVVWWLGAGVVLVKYIPS